MRCLSKTSTTAVLGGGYVCMDSWPGDTNITSRYLSYFGQLTTAVSNMWLPYYSNNDTTPNGIAAALENTLRSGIVPQAETNGKVLWLRPLESTTVYGNTKTAYMAFITYKGDFAYYGGQSISTVYGIAPYFTLDLTQVAIDESTNTIQLALS